MYIILILEKGSGIVIVEVDTNRMNKINANIREKINDFSDCIKKFSNIVENINIAWNGADALKYINTMKEKNLIELNKLNELLTEYNDFISKIPQAYNLLDEIYSSKSIGN